MQHGVKTATQEQNELWNEIHVNLVRDLESKGLLWRYGVKHLKLWTDMILDGKCSGVGEEPQWEEHLEQVIIPPKSRKSTPSSSSSTTSSSEGGKCDRSIIELMMLQHQQSMEAESRRAEMFQKTLLTMMSSNVALLQNQVNFALATDVSPQVILYNLGANNRIDNPKYRKFCTTELFLLFSLLLLF